jgi:regulator of protease activity HflC (stomatin/prohibitin superfamily)
MIVSVPTGHTGILTTFGKVEDGTLESGIHIKMPYQNLVVMDNRTQKATLELSCFSSDIQEVPVTYSINYQINKENAQKIYKTVGVDYYDVIMVPRIQEAVKSVIAKYSAENLIASREDLSKQITDILVADLESYDIIVVNTAIENLDFSDAFTNAVEEKQVAEQQKLKAAIEQEQLNIEASASAERDIIAANAEAEVTKIQAEMAQYAGEREAEKNRKLAENLTPELIQYYYIDKWNGEVPQISGVDSVMPVLEGISGGITVDTDSQ